MTARLKVKIEKKDGTHAYENFKISRMYNFGSATRDPDTAVAHQEEVAKSGIHIAFDIPAPRIYPIARHALTTDEQVLVQSEKTSGEVEIVIHIADQIYIGVGSDHTDRRLETVSIMGSKQSCPNHVCPVFWPYEEIREAWDSYLLKSWVDSRLYQEVGVNAFLRPEHVLEILRERVNNVPERDLMIFCGTIASVDKALGFGREWRYSLSNSEQGRMLGAGYEVINVMDEVKPEFRVPFFNPNQN